MSHMIFMPFAHAAGYSYILYARQSESAPHLTHVRITSAYEHARDPLHERTVFDVTLEPWELRRLCGGLNETLEYLGDVEGKKPRCMLPPEHPVPLRCEVGDTAVVLRAPPGCDDVVGRIVMVEDRYFRTPDQWFWAVRPLLEECWTWYDMDTGKNFLTSFFDTDLYLPDNWLQPLRATEVQAAQRDSQEKHP